MSINRAPETRESAALDKLFTSRIEPVDPANEGIEFPILSHWDP
jgi:hypothetical protein